MNSKGGVRMIIVIMIIFSLFFLIVGLVVGFLIFKFSIEKKLVVVRGIVELIVEDVKKEVEIIKKEVLFEVKEENYRLCIEIENEFCGWRIEI